MRYYLMIFMALLFSSCEEKNAIAKEPLLIFSEDYTTVSVFLPTLDFQHSKAERLYNQGVDFIKNENFEKAEEKFLAALAIEPDHPGLLTDLGNISANKNNYKEALDYYKKAYLKSKSTYYRAIYNTGITYIFQEEFKCGIEVLNEVQQYPLHPMLKASSYYFLNKAYAKIGSCGESMEAAKKFHDLTSYNPDFSTQQEFLFDLANACTLEAFNQKSMDKEIQEFKFISEKVEYRISSSNYNIEISNEKDSLRISEIQLTGSDDLLSFKRIVKSDFEDFLYRDFYAESELSHTKIINFRNKKIYFYSELVNRDTDNRVQILFFIPLKNNELGQLELEDVSYKKPHLNNITSNDALKPEY